VSESKGIESELIPRISTGFCGGISRTCGICGAVSGGIMALNIFFGRNKPDESTKKSYSAVQKLVKMFEVKFESTNCQQLTGCDLGTEQGRKKFHSGNLIQKCRKLTEEATRLTMSIIEEQI
jgi:C_GCAxxG_C_C family probable redox protein